ncbi:MAG: hemerythrin domain-containing protein [Hyphomicrobiaceae bacterium]
MAKPVQKRTRATAALGRLAPQLIKTPLEYILADHHRQRELFSLCDAMAEAEAFDADLADTIATFLETEMELHVIDEEEDLFPMLRRRLLPDDDAERLMGLLSGEHAADEALAGEIGRGLREGITANCATIALELRNALLTFADRQRRHLAVENAIVLPLAASRLSQRDIADLGRRMAVRRGISQSQD